MRGAGVFLCAGVLLAGCHDPVTEVVVVMTSDMNVSQQQAMVSAVPGTDMPPSFFGANVPISSFPLSVGIQGLGQTSVFSVGLELTSVDRLTFQLTPLVVRNVFGIRFVPGEIRMLVVPMLQACACDGTACPVPGVNPDCDDIWNPETVPFDPEVAPPSGSSTGQFFKTSVGTTPAL